MARIRTIKPAFFTSEDTCSCSPLARLLFLGMLTEADKAGRLEDRPGQLRRRLLPEDQCDVDALLWELVERRLVRRYDASGVQIVQILNFEKHQKPHPKEAESTIPKDGVDRKPDLKTVGLTQATIHPVENPSTTHRYGSGVSDPVISGTEISDQEGRESLAPAPKHGSLIVSPLELHRRHGQHVPGFCDFVCFPQASFNDFVNRAINGGATEPEATANVSAWATSVRHAWQGRIPGSNIFKFWDNEWEATHGSNRPTPGAVDVTAGLRNA